MRVGLAKRDLTVWDRGMLMLGWAQYENRADHVSEALAARAVVLEDAHGARVALVCVDLCFVTEPLRDAVLAALAAHGSTIPREALVLCATHTHSGPSGFTGEIYFDAMSGGFAPERQRRLAERIAEAVWSAERALAPGRVRVARGELPLEPPVMFNRALEAYLRNPDVPATRRPEEAVDRTMTLLRFEDEAGVARGALTFLGLHGTTVHAEHSGLHPDHKGLACGLLDAHAAAHGGSADFVSIFAQGPAGDVTPNPRWDAARKRAVGPIADDLEHARRVAEVQATLAARLLDEARHSPPEQDVVRAALVRLRPGDHTAQRLPVLGLAMALGTDEGPGPLHPARRVVRTLGALARRVGLDPKVPMLDLGRGLDGRAFGVLPLRALAPLAAVDVAVSAFAALRGEAARAPLLPLEFPVQVVCIGQLALACLPCEPTTVSGRRMRAAVRELLGFGVVICTYANAYAGYVTTPEEYAAQGYEGAYTLYGERTLDAWLGALRACAEQLRPQGAIGSDESTRSYASRSSRVGVQRPSALRSETS